MTKIVLSLRLQAIADRVSVGARFVDVGTDHALLPSYLIQAGVVSFAIATDVAQGPCEAARNTVRRNGFEDAIHVRHGDGLKTVNPGEVDTIAIAGMGGHTATEILTTSPHVALAASRLIVQPMNAAHHVRKYFRRHDFLIADDIVLYEDGRYYQIVVADKQSVTHMEDPYIPFEDDPLWLELAFEYGPTLLRQPTSTFVEYMKQNVVSWQRILENMQQSQSDEATLRQDEMTEKIRRVEQWILDINQ